jgi:hypothetical protein
VAREPEKVEVLVVDLGVARVRKLVAPAQEARAGAVLEPAVAVADRRDLEQVAFERCLAEKIDLPLADAREVAGEAREVRVVASGDRDLVRDAAGLKADKIEVTGFDRMVDQLVVARGLVSAESSRKRRRARQGGRDFPMCEIGTAGGAISTLQGEASRPSGQRKTADPLKYPRVESR